MFAPEVEPFKSESALPTMAGANPDAIPTSMARPLVNRLINSETDLVSVQRNDQGLTVFKIPIQSNTMWNIEFR